MALGQERALQHDAERDHKEDGDECGNDGHFRICRVGALVLAERGPVGEGAVFAAPRNR